VEVRSYQEAIFLKLVCDHPKTPFKEKDHYIQLYLALKKLVAAHPPPKQYSNQNNHASYHFGGNMKYISESMI